MDQNETEQKQLPLELSEIESREDVERKKRREVIFELALFLVLGILLGITFKTEAAKRITIGFNDYKIAAGKNGYNIEEMKKNLELQAQAEQEAMQQAPQQTQTPGQPAGVQVQPQQ